MFPLGSLGSLYSGGNSAPLVLLAGLGAAYIFYYVRAIVKKPRLACKDGALKQLLLEKCPALKQEFWPTPWCWGGRLSTIVTSLVKSQPAIRFDDRETLPLADGGEIVIDWLHGAGPIDSQPTVLILPGINGNATASYVLHLATEFKSLGYRTAVINHRGRGGSTLLTPRAYCACNTDDLKAAVHHIKQKYHDSSLIAVGISLGGLILFHYIVQHGRKNCGLIAGMTVSMAWDVFESSKELEKPLNSLVLNRPVAKGLVDGIRGYLHLFQELVTTSDVMKSKTIREFDERFTAKVFGYDSVEAYYRDATACDKVHRVEIPLLCLNAADDPFSPERSLPVEAADANEHVMLVVTKRGGHVAFNNQLLWPSSAGYMEEVAAEYVSAVFENADRLTRTS